MQATEAGTPAASEEEASPGEVVFSSADEGVRFRDDRPVMSPSDARALRVCAPRARAP